MDFPRRGHESVEAPSYVDVGVELQVLDLVHDEHGVVVDFDGCLRGVEGSSGLEDVEEARFPYTMQSF